MQISHHHVGAPAADELDAIRVDIGTQEGHGAGGPEGSGRDMVGQKTINGAQERRCEAKRRGEVRWGDAPECGGGGVKIRGQGLGACGVVGPQVNHSTGCGQHRAEQWVAAATQSDTFSPDGIFLCRKLQGHKGGGWEAGDVGCECVQAGRADEQGHIFKVERLRFACCPGVFTRSQEEEKRKADHVGTGCFWNGVGAGGLHGDVAEDLDWNGFDAEWWGI